MDDNENTKEATEQCGVKGFLLPVAHVVLPVCMYVQLGTRSGAHVASHVPFVMEGTALPSSLFPVPSPPTLPRRASVLPRLIVPSPCGWTAVRDHWKGNKAARQAEDCGWGGNE